MVGFTLIDVGLGLILVYLLLSLACTAGTEMIAGILRLRARTLAKGLENMLHDEKLQKELLNHPLIQSLYRRFHAPSYIPARTFALTLTHILAGADRSQTLGDIKSGVKNWKDSPALQKAIGVLVDEAGKDVGKLRKNIETWYDDTMDRVAGWYKARTQTITFVLALAIAGGLNVDTVQIARSLWSDRALRETVAARADAWAKSETLSEEGSRSVAQSAARAKELLKEVEDLALPITWKEAPKSGELVSKIGGILITTLAMSLGAPFWFDLLKKVANIRSSGQVSAQTDQKQTAAPA